MVSRSGWRSQCSRAIQSDSVQRLHKAAAQLRSHKRMACGVEAEESDSRWNTWSRLSHTLYGTRTRDAEMRSPGFTADATLERLTGCYVGEAGKLGRAVLGGRVSKIAAACMKSGG